MSRICVSLTAPTMAELRRRRDRVVDADLIELRLDSVADPDVSAALAGRTRPVIITCRPQWEGGAFRGTEEERRRILADALDAGAEYVDLELSAGLTDLVRRGGRRVVLSMHDFHGVPSDLAARVHAMCAARPGVVKVAVTARCLADWIPLMAIASRARASNTECVWIAMGTPGLPTRILAERFGSCWTYAGDGVAPGQIPADCLIHEYGFRHLTASTAVYGVVGSPVTHSVSPAMHNAAFRVSGRDAVYVPIEAASVDDFERAAAALDLQGASVTIPYKVKLFEHVVAGGDPRALDPLSRSVGAINTLRRHEGRWQGRNTDVAGFLAPLAGRVSLEGARAMVLGAGGAARAVAVALASKGTRVSVYARALDRARDVAALAGGEAAGWPPPAGGWDLLVNTTPLGMTPRVEETPWPHPSFDGRLVYDLVYHPGETRLLREARAAGCDVVGGLEMLVAQAQEQAAWWTGLRPSAGLLHEAALRALGTTGVAQPVER